MILLKLLWANTIARIVAGVLVAWAALLANNAYQRYQGGEIRETKIVEKRNAVAKKRDRIIRKARRNTKSDDAFRRLQSEFADPN